MHPKIHGISGDEVLEMIREGRKPKRDIVISFLPLEEEDGKRDLDALRQSGARTLGQDEATSVVYGMPKVAAQLGAVQKQLPLDAIAAEIATLTSTTRTRG